MAGNTATWAGDFFAPFSEEVHSRFSQDFPNIDMLRLMFRDAEKYGMGVGELRLTEISQDELAADIYLIAKLIDSLIKAEAEAEALRALLSPGLRVYKGVHVVQIYAGKLGLFTERYEGDSDLGRALRVVQDAAIDAARKGAE